MKFDYDAYNELFPREDARTGIESAVSTFKPTEKVEAEAENEEAKEVEDDGLDNSGESVRE